MRSYSLGDLANSFAMRNQSTQIRQTIERLAQELASGRTSDVLDRVSGDYSRLSSIEHRSTLLDGYQVARGEAETLITMSELQLGRMQDATLELSELVLTVGSSPLDTVAESIGNQARQTLDSIVAGLNSTIAGRSLFAGTATDVAPLAGSEEILDALKSVIAGQGSAADVKQAAADWFDDPNGFRAMLYTGSTDDLAPIGIGENESVSMSLRADDSEFRDLIQRTALSLLAVDPATSLSEAERNVLLEDMGGALKSSDDQLTQMRAYLGNGQQRIEEASARQNAEQTVLDYTRNAIVEADPYETAIRLEDAQFRIESLYTVTVRMSQLSLVNFLR